MSDKLKPGPEVPTVEIYKDIVETVPVIGLALGKAVLAVAAGIDRIEARLLANTERNSEAGSSEH